MTPSICFFARREVKKFIFIFYGWDLDNWTFPSKYIIKFYVDHRGKNMVFRKLFCALCTLNCTVWQKKYKRGIFWVKSTSNQHVLRYIFLPMLYLKNSNLVKKMIPKVDFFSLFFPLNCQIKEHYATINWWSRFCQESGQTIFNGVR